MAATESSDECQKCAICLGSMKAGDGHALFTAECSHTFHFHCITTNVSHGNYVCPLCKATWKEIPLQAPLALGHPHHGRAVLEDGSRLSRAASTNRQQHHFRSNFYGSEPSSFSDDEPLDLQSAAARDPRQGRPEMVEVEIHPEFSAVAQSDCLGNFAVLMHVKAPHAAMNQSPRSSLTAAFTVPQNVRAPVDLVTVLDVSGSMAGTKLALLKRALSFLIQNLGPSDRLSVVAFSSTARRLIPLCRMSDSGRQQALQAVNSLVSSGGTNIAEGLRKGFKVIEERRERNPVCSILLLSDGQDTYTFSSSGGAQPSQPDYKALVPSSVLSSAAVSVHSIGFGADHDSAAMHAIAEISGGTFSFIESEGVLQDAFAQCIGGILSVVVQEMRLGVECVHPGVRLAPINSGSYRNQLLNDARTGFIYVGDLYADEERDFLVSVNVPFATEETALLKVACVYKDPVSKEAVRLPIKEVRIQRPQVVSSQTPSIEVDREDPRPGRRGHVGCEGCSRARFSVGCSFDSGGAPENTVGVPGGAGERPIVPGSGCGAERDAREDGKPTAVRGLGARLCVVGAELALMAASNRARGLHRRFQPPPFLPDAIDGGDATPFPDAAPLTPACRPAHPADQVLPISATANLVTVNKLRGGNELSPPVERRCRVTFLGAAFGFGVVHGRRSSLKTTVRGIDLCKYLGVHSSCLNHAAVWLRCVLLKTKIYHIIVSHTKEL
ncbi:VWA domain containing CoxE-like protein, partial [Musa troglodytarum]